MRSKYYDIHEKAIKQRSITPETYRGDKAKFIECEVLSVDQTNLVKDELFYVDYYQYKDSITSHVMHFGINTYSEILIKELEKYNFVKKGKLLELKSISGVLSQKDKAIENITTLDKTAKSLLTEFEKNCVNNAILHLKNTAAKTVLVDVFARDADNNIIIQKSEPETHTVVLFQQNNKFLVIDPSNASFSRILVGVSEDIIICPTDKLQIYKPLGQTGPNPDNWRDCIDVAVKIAFNLNTNFKLGLDNIKINQLTSQNGLVKYDIIDYASLKESPSIKEVTNQKVIYSKLPKLIEEFPIREKQSSEVKQEKKVTTLLKYIDNAFSKLALKVQELDLYHYNDDTQKTFQKLLSIPCHYTEYNKVIEEFTLFTHEICDTVGEQTKLLGNELSSIDKLCDGV